MWTAAQLTGASVLSEADALLLGTGYDGASSMVYDPGAASLYLAENNYGTGLNRIVLANGPGDLAHVLVDGPAWSWITNLERVPGAGPAAFLPFQPASGGALRYNTTDFATATARLALHPRRPELVLGGPGLTGAGSLDVALQLGPPDGLSIVAFGPQTSQLGTELVLTLGSLPPLFLGLDPGALYPLAGPFALDGSGAFTAGFHNPGDLHGQLALQALVLDSAGFPLGTSAVVLN